MTNNLNISAPEHDSYVFSAQVTVSSMFLIGMRLYVMTLTPRILPFWGPSTAQIFSVLRYTCDVIKLLDTLQMKTGEFSRESPFDFPLTAFSEPMPHFLPCTCLPDTAVLCVLQTWKNKLEILYSCINITSWQSSVCVTNLGSRCILDARLEAFLIGL